MEDRQELWQHHLLHSLHQRCKCSCDLQAAEAEQHGGRAAGASGDVEQPPE